jgi:hypothetical protein
MKVERLLSLAVLALFLLAASGCSSSQAKVSGKVTLDGTPVDKGSILFEPADGKTATAGGDIVNGAYSVANVPPGPKNVKVSVSKKVGEHKAFPDDPNSQMIDDIKDITSTQTFEVKAGNNDGPTFELKSDK